MRSVQTMDARRSSFFFVRRPADFHQDVSLATKLVPGVYKHQGQTFSLVQRLGPTKVHVFQLGIGRHLALQPEDETCKTHGTSNTFTFLLVDTLCQLIPLGSNGLCG